MNEVKCAIRCNVIIIFVNYILVVEWLGKNKDTTNRSTALCNSCETRESKGMKTVVEEDLPRAAPPPGPPWGHVLISIKVPSIPGG